MIQVLLFFALVEPVPRPVQPAADPAARRLVADRAGAAREWLPSWYRFRPYGFLVLLIVGFSTNLFGRLFAPFFDGLFDFIVR